MAGENNILGQFKMLKMTPFNEKGDKHDTHTVLVNPETFKESYNIILDTKQESGSDTTEGKYLRTDPGDLEFTLLFDSTGMFEEGFTKSIKNSIQSIIPGEKNQEGISKKISKFKDDFIGYNGNYHEPPCARFEWGDFSYECRIENIEIDYKLFNASGKPIRAFVKLKAKEIMPKKKADLVQGDTSPDMTHYRTVKGGDTIQLLTKDIYGDPKYYLEVARANKLIQFRNLKPGRNLVFPPIEKM